MSDSDKRHNQMMQLAPDNWDKKPLGLASELRSYLEAVKDEGTAIDSGGGDEMGDLWVTVQGVEYFIAIRPSKQGWYVCKDCDSP